MNISGREELNRWFMGDLGRWRGFCSVLCNYEGNHQITISLVYFCRCAGMYLFDCVHIKGFMSGCVCVRHLLIEVPVCVRAFINVSMLVCVYTHERECFPVPVLL